jgi:hypothetical protein
MNQKPPLFDEFEDELLEELLDEFELELLDEFELELLDELELELLDEFELELLDEFELELPAYAVAGTATPIASAAPTVPAPTATFFHVLDVCSMTTCLPSIGYNSSFQRRHETHVSRL